MKHKIKLLTKEEVEKLRCSAYSYVCLDKKCNYPKCVYLHDCTYKPVTS